MESPTSVQNYGLPERKEPKGKCAQAFSATLDLGGQFLCMGEDSVVALETGAAATSVCFRRLGNPSMLSGKQKLRRIPTYPASARFKCGDGSLG